MSEDVSAPVDGAIENSAPAEEINTQTEANAEAEAAGAEQDLQEQIEEALPDLSPEQVSKLIAQHKFTVKVDGEEKQVDYDTMMRDYQLAQASQKRFQEAKEYKQTAESLLEQLRKDPRKALSHPDIGIDLNDFAEKILAESIEEELMDPKDRELRDLRTKMQAIEAEKEAKAQEAAKSEEEQQLAQWAEEWVDNFNKEAPEVLKSKGVPTNPRMLKRLRDYATEAMTEGYDLKLSELATFVKEDFQSELKELFASSPSDILADLVGVDALKSLRKVDLDSLGHKSKPKAAEKEKSSELPDDATLEEVLAALGKSL